jgi:DNA (cytosine-5)-methyltransferase 1
MSKEAVFLDCCKVTFSLVIVFAFIFSLLTRRHSNNTFSPGESLPPFPKPTYPDPGPYRTVRDAIGDGAIPLEASLQQQYEFETPRNPSCDWDQPCRNTILAGGGSYDVHPNGRRQFTLRELACLQSFPVDHEFNREGSQTTRTSIRRQIGNAVPPVMAKALFGAIRKHMEVVDRQRDRGT